MAIQRKTLGWKTAWSFSLAFAFSGFLSAGVIVLEANVDSAFVDFHNAKAESCDLAQPCESEPRDLAVFCESEPPRKSEPPQENQPLLVFAEKTQLNPRHWHQELHRHRHHELVVVQNGRLGSALGNSASGDPALGAGPGEVLFFPATQPHAEQALPGPAIVKFTLGFFCSTDLSAVPRKLVDRHGRLRELADWLCADTLSGVLCPPQAPPLLYGLISELVRAAEQDVPGLLTSCRRVVRQSMDQNLCVAELARRVGMSRSHFSRAFSAETGQSPSVFLREERAVMARTLLRTSTMGVKEVAAAVGIGSAQQLSRMLRRRYGLSPRALRTGIFA